MLISGRIRRRLRASSRHARHRFRHRRQSLHPQAYRLHPSRESGTLTPMSNYYLINFLYSQFHPFTFLANSSGIILFHFIPGLYLSFALIHFPSGWTKHLPLWIHGVGHSQANGTAVDPWYVLSLYADFMQNVRISGIHYIR